MLFCTDTSRRALAGSAALLLGVGLASALPPGTAAAAPDSPGATAPGHLEVGGLTDPLGIDDTTPTLSWQDATAIAEQSAFQVRAATTEAGLDDPDLWDSGRVDSAALSTAYAGTGLDSRDRAYWQVRVWDADGAQTAWSDPARFEIGLLSEADWSADWITNPEWNQPLHQDLAFDTAQTAQYVRVTVTDLGRPEEPLNDPAWKPRLELGEIALRDSNGGTANLAEGATVTASERKNQTGVWEPQFVVDGKFTTADAPRGFRSLYHPETDVQDSPIVLTLKLPEARTFDTLELYSLWDSPGGFGTTPNYPRDVTVATSVDGTSYTTVASAKKLPAISTVHEAPEALPVFATDFDADDVVSARLYVAGLGVYNASINGQAVSEDLLEPANTEHAKRVPYATYDVTELLADGENSLGIEVGNGIFNVFNTPDNTSRYVKTASGHGAPRVIGQLELTDAQGDVTTVATDAGEDTSWRTTLGEVTFTNWYGGEDVDARRHIEGWDEPGTARDSWQAPVASAAPKRNTRLVGRVMPPIRQVDTLDQATWTEPVDGTYVFDFGVNFAGWQELTASGPAGTEITMRPGERLTAEGTVDQRSSGPNAYDTFTLAGAGTETYRPRFRYHGMQYLQVEGLPGEPTASTVKGLVLRADNADVGEFDSSDEMLNSIHALIDRSVQSNMYSVMTDCPHREKLGWLDQTNLNFTTATRGYDMQAQYRKLLQDVVDAQQPDGLIPTTAPEDSMFAGAFRHDANWGATLAVSSWQVYTEYGDTEPMREFWPNMVRYQDYLASEVRGGVLPGGLNDWATPEEAVDRVPDALVQTYAYHKITRTMADIATVLGRPAAARTYTARAARIAEDYRSAYYDAEQGTWSNGNQAALALSLDEDLVPEDQRDAAVQALVTRIEADGGQFMVGEVGLYALLRVLAEEGRHDLIHELATRPTGNSYAKFVNSGSTSLPEHWSGRGGTGSQNHYMLGMLEGWLNESLAGLTQAPDSVAFEHVVVQPALVEGVDSASTTYDSVRGPIATSWSRDQGTLDLTVEVPGNTTATVRVPEAADGSPAYGPRGAQVVPSDVDGYTQFEVGAGTWEFGSGGDAPTWATQVTVETATVGYGSGDGIDVSVTDGDGAAVDGGSVTVTGLGRLQTTDVVDGVASVAVPVRLAPGPHDVAIAYSGAGRYEDTAAAASVRVTKAGVDARASVRKAPTTRRPGRIRVVLSSDTRAGALPPRDGSRWC
ncbi:family 78 glycoside hydrolase catalytic domain [Nocardioides sambongensis]|uniref:family 78 glycoside hydrolase catalytic domain n=1 Tax=Nocardioides sambongensis TaxID=2589074 RepID=UPI001126DCDC|nr:family 78 glycoside hydrolase catalytic domain [Nocardioides sambongensis]